ncbi:MAG: hypothetical protein WA364_23850 [Candidatus Nitrosopolaris sp.]
MTIGHNGTANFSANGTNAEFGAPPRTVVSNPTIRHDPNGGLSIDANFNTKNVSDMSGMNMSTSNSNDGGLSITMPAHIVPSTGPVVQLANNTWNIMNSTSGSPGTIKFYAWCIQDEPGYQSCYSKFDRFLNGRHLLGSTDGQV